MIWRVVSGLNALIFLAAAISYYFGDGDEFFTFPLLCTAVCYWCDQVVKESR